LLLGRLNPDGFFLAPRKAREGEGRRPPCRYEATAPPRRPQKLAWVKVGARASRRSVNTMEACRILLDEETMAWGLPAHAQMHVYCLGQVVWCCGGTVKGRKRVVVAGRQGGFRRSCKSSLGAALSRPSAASPPGHSACRGARLACVVM
jgi:hypothetical protein